MQKTKIRGLAHLAAGVFCFSGAIVFLKSIQDIFWGEPEANFYSPKPWDFVSREEWLRYGGFELAYACACLALAWFLFRFARRLPEWVERPRSEEPSRLF